MYTLKIYIVTVCSMQSRKGQENMKAIQLP